MARASTIITVVALCFAGMSNAIRTVPVDVLWIVMVFIAIPLIIRIRCVIVGMLLLMVTEEYLSAEIIDFLAESDSVLVKIKQKGKTLNNRWA